MPGKFIPHARNHHHIFRIYIANVAHRPFSSFAMSTLSRQLLDLITKSLSTLETACSSKDLKVPDLYEPFHPSSEAFRADPQVAEAAATISAAALHLEAIFTPPHVSLYHLVGGVRPGALPHLPASYDPVLSTSSPPRCVSVSNRMSPKFCAKGAPRLVRRSIVSHPRMTLPAGCAH